MADIDLFLNKDLAFINAHRALRSIWMKPGVSRSELSGMLDLDKSTITKLVADLLKRGIVEEFAEGASGHKGGRKPVLLKVKRDFGAVLGIEIQTERYVAVLLDLTSQTVYTRSEPIAARSKEIADLTVSVVREVSRDVEQRGLKILGVGVGLSGIVDTEHGIIRQSLPLGVDRPVNLYEAARDVVAVPLKVDNDANCCCWAEIVRNHTAISRDFLFILGEFRKERVEDTDGTTIAVGIGFVIDGKVHLGSSWSAGEFRSVFREAETKSQFSLPYKTIRQSEHTESVFKQVARELGKNAALLVNSLDLSHVFIGGNIEKYRNILIPILSAEIKKNWPYGDKQLTIEFSELGELVVAYGAAAMMLERLFALPQIAENRPNAG